MVQTKLNELTNKLHTPKWLFYLLAGVLVLRIPSFFEPYSYGDEMIYLTLGNAVRQGVPLYSGIHDNKPPLLYLTAGVSGNLFWFKAILALWSLITVFLFWKLAEKLFPNNKKLQKISTVVFAIFTTIPLLEGNIVNAELFMIGLTIGGFLLLLSKKLKLTKIFLAGILFSLAALFKVPSFFDVFAIIILWLVIAKPTKKGIKKVVVNSFVLGMGFLVPIALTFVWYTARGAFNEYLVAAFLQNVGYLSTWRPGDVQEPFLTRNGPLLFRGVVVGVALLILYWKRKRLSWQFIFITSWLLLALFAVTLSERPYPHYLVQAVAPVSLLVGMLFALKKREQFLTIIPLALAFLVPVYLNFWYYPTVPYYLRFVKFAAGQIPREEYLATFGGNVNRNYKIANYLTASTKPTDKVFVWGDSSAIYALSRRLPPGKYVADYHIRDFSTSEETLLELSNNMPKMIVVLPDSPSYPELIFFLRDNYLLLDTIDGAQIWSLLNPSVRALISR